ncbi:hypothetical protein [Vibrio alfacsensis]|nr:hypothetical protein [Vibrio alfacsensis]
MMLNQISSGFVGHVGNLTTAIPFAIVLITLFGIALISHYRQSL